MHCRTCGRHTVDHAAACIACGVSPLAGNEFCQTCGAETNPAEVMCVKCGGVLHNDVAAKGEIRSSRIVKEEKLSDSGNSLKTSRQLKRQPSTKESKMSQHRINVVGSVRPDRSESRPILEPVTVISSPAPQAQSAGGAGWFAFGVLASLAAGFAIIAMISLHSQRPSADSNAELSKSIQELVAALADQQRPTDDSNAVLAKMEKLAAALEDQRRSGHIAVDEAVNSEEQVRPAVASRPKTGPVLADHGLARAEEHARRTQEMLMNEMENDSRDMEEMIGTLIDQSRRDAEVMKRILKSR